MEAEVVSEMRKGLEATFSIFLTLLCSFSSLSFSFSINFSGLRNRFLPFAHAFCHSPAGIRQEREAEREGNSDRS